MLTFAVLLFIAALLLLQGGKLVALSDDVKAFRDEVSPKLDAAIADIQKLHDLLSGSDPDIPGALAALEELRGKFGDLQAAVDIPEPGDPPPPPPA